MHVAVALDARPGEQFGLELVGEPISCGVNLRWRDRAEIDDLGAAAAGRLHDHKADAAKTAVPRFAHRQREGGRDDRIDGAAAGGQYLGADRRRDAVLRRHHAAA